MYGRLGAFEPGDVGKYTKSSQRQRGSEDEDDDRFTYSRMFRVPTQQALQFRRSTQAQSQGLPESVQFKNRIKNSVQKYLNSKEGHELNKHIESLKRSLD